MGAGYLNAPILYPPLSNASLLTIRLEGWRTSSIPAAAERNTGGVLQCTCVGGYYVEQGDVYTSGGVSKHHQCIKKNRIRSHGYRAESSRKFRRYLTVYLLQLPPALRTTNQGRIMYPFA